MYATGGSYLAKHLVREHPDVGVHRLLALAQHLHGRQFAKYPRPRHTARSRSERHNLRPHRSGKYPARRRLPPRGPRQCSGIVHHAQAVSATTSSVPATCSKAFNCSARSGHSDMQHVGSLWPGRSEFLPITEEAPLQPASPYAVWKVAQDLLGQVYFMAYKLRVIRTRMFAYLIRGARICLPVLLPGRWPGSNGAEEGTGARQPRFGADPDRRSRCLSGVLGRPVYCQPGEAYNIGGATTMTVGQFLDLLISLARVAFRRAAIRTCCGPPNVTLQIPCVDKFIQATGWQPKYSFEESVANLLDHWRRKAELASRAP